MYTFDPKAPFSPFWPRIPLCPWKHLEQKYIKILKRSPEYLMQWKNKLQSIMGENICQQWWRWDIAAWGKCSPCDPSGQEVLAFLEILGLPEIWSECQWSRARSHGWSTAEQWDKNLLLILGIPFLRCFLVCLPLPGRVRTFVNYKRNLLKWV